MRYCEKCGYVMDEYDIYRNKQNCPICSNVWSEDDMTALKYAKLSESEKDAYELKIYNICKQSEFFDENDYTELHSDLEDWYFTFRFDKYEQLSGEKAFTKENELYHKMEAHKRVSEAMAKYAGTTTSSFEKDFLSFCILYPLYKTIGIEVTGILISSNASLNLFIALDNTSNFSDVIESE